MKLAIDIKGPMKKGPKYLLVIVDYYSKWPEVWPIKKITSSEVIRVMRSTFGRMGYPREIVSDNGTQLVSKKVEEWLSSNGVSHHKIALYAPAQNGLVERFNRVIREKLLEADRFAWKVDETLDKMLMDYRSTPHSTTGVSPFEALYGRKMDNRMRAFAPNLERGGDWKAIDDKLRKMP